MYGLQTLKVSHKCVQYFSRKMAAKIEKNYLYDP